jgi:ribonuclease J
MTMINLLRPRFFVPVHGELRHLVQHAKLAHELGIAKKDIAVIENGYPLTFDGDRMQIGERVPGDYIFVDGSLVGEVGPMVMGQRDELAQSGFVTAVARYDRKEGKIVGKPRIITQGFVYVPDAEDLLARAGDVVRSAASVKKGTASRKVEEKIERALSSFLYQETKRKPVVTVALTEA